MRHPLSWTGARDGALLWVACAIALCAGWYVAFVVLGSAVDRQHQRTADTDAALRLDAALLARRSELAEVQHMLDHKLAQAQLDSARPAAVARFVRLTAQIAAAHGAALASVDERSLNAPAASGDASAPAAFDPIPLEATLTGDYRSLLATMRALAASPQPMRLELTSLARNGAPETASAALTARLRVTLERLADGATDTTAHSTSP